MSSSVHAVRAIRVRTLPLRLAVIRVFLASFSKVSLVPAVPNLYSGIP